MSTDSWNDEDHWPGVTLKFVVVGGGISGLATAYTLRKAGHDVVLLEKGDGKAKNPCGIRSPPNMTRLLNRWGLDSKLDRKSGPCQRIDMFSGQSGDHLGTLAILDHFLVDLLANIVFIQHGDLRSLLHDQAREEGVLFRFNSRVVDLSLETGSVTLDTGEKLECDVVIGADGYDSMLRKHVVGRDDLNEDKHLVLGFVASVEDMMKDDELRSLVADPSVWSFWAGDGYVFHSNVVNGDTEYTVTFVHNYYGEVQEEDKHWKPIVDLGPYGIDLDRLEPRVRKLISLGKNVSGRVMESYPCLESLVSQSSKLVLVGEAGHPILPGGHHSTAISLEDAEALGRLFSRIQDRKQVSQLLTAYDEIQHPRTAAVQKYVYEHQAGLKVPPGPAQEARDAMFQATLIHKEGDNMDESLFRQIWGQELDIFAYDVTEQVDDWWNQFGSLIVKRPHRKSILSDMKISVEKDSAMR